MNRVSLFSNRGLRAALMLVVLAIFAKASFAQYIAVTDFSITDLGNGKYQFHPVCNQINCNSDQLKKQLYMWEFGDGDYSFDSIPIKAYWVPGVYNVTLRVTNIYEDDQRKRESPPGDLITLSFGPKTVDNSKSTTSKAPALVPAVYANAIVKAGYPVKYEYELFNQTSLPMPVTGTLSRDPRQYWIHANNLPYTADYNDSIFTSLTFDSSDSTLDFSGTIPPYTRASIVLTFNAADPQDGSDLWAKMISNGCNSFVCDSAVETTILNRVGKSWDPNSIEAMPDKFAVAGEDLFYIIHFENEGSAPARQIIIRDTMPVILDIQSFKHLNSSHPEYLDTVLVEGRVVTWIFKDIYLPGKEVGDRSRRNQGYVSFKLRVNPHAYARTFVDNHAWIVFDEHAPISTNEVANRVLKEECETSLSYSSFRYALILLVLLVVILLWVIARYRIRNPVVLQRIPVPQDRIVIEQQDREFPQQQQMQQFPDNEDQSH